jgi:hypothetical protein
MQLLFNRKVKAMYISGASCIVDMYVWVLEKNTFLLRLIDKIVIHNPMIFLGKADI